MSNDPTKNTDIVFITRDDMLIDSIISYLNSKQKSLKTEKYNSPLKFLSDQKYPKDAKVCICHRDFDGVKMYGIELAKSLHEDGYKKLYLRKCTKLSDSDT